MKLDFRDLLYIIGIAVLSLESCADNTESYNGAPQGAIPTVAPIPEYYHQDVVERTRYAIEHYYQDTNWQDSSWQTNPELRERSIRGYLSLITSLTHIDKEWLLLPLEQTNGAVMEDIVRYYNKVLGDPASLLYSRAYHRDFVQWVRQSPKVSRPLADSVAPPPPMPQPDSLAILDSLHRIDSLGRDSLPQAKLSVPKA